MNGRKSQVEIIGIAIVLVIVILGSLFIFGLNRQSEKSAPVSISEETRINKLGSNFLNAMLKTTIECGDDSYSFQDLFKDCLSQQNLILCGSSNSCGKIQDLLKNNFLKVLDNMEEYYVFKVYFKGEEQKDFERKSNPNLKIKCRKQYTFNQVFQTFDLDEIKLELILCAE
ncbi:MAG: hypothetical protein QXU20_02485 [Candidatus Woesearchaeota archaeon]